MELSFIIKGIIIGLSVAAPVGPIGILCIRRGLNKGFWSGFSTGLGAATADAFYGAIAGLGLTLISGFLIGYKILIQSIGIAFLIYLGIRIFFEKPKTKEISQNVSNRGLILDYLSSLGLTITNPTTIISFVAIFAGVGIVNTSENYTNASILILGVFLGSTLWWLILSSLVGYLKRQIGDNILNWVNRVSGIILILFAIGLIIRLL